MLQYVIFDSRLAHVNCNDVRVKRWPKTDNKDNFTLLVYRDDDKPCHMQVYVSMLSAQSL